MDRNRPNNFTSIGNVDTYGANNPNSINRNMGVNMGGNVGMVQPGGSGVC